MHARVSVEVARWRSRWTVAVLAVCGLMVAAPVAAIPQVTLIGFEKGSSGDWDLPARLVGTLPAIPASALDKHIINRADCKAILAASNPTVKTSWTWLPTSVLATASISGVFKLAPRGKTCVEGNLGGETADSTCLLSSTFDYAIKQSFDFEFNLKTALGSGIDCNDQTEQEATVYMVVTDLNTGVGIGGATTNTAFTFKTRLVVDLAGPPTPTISSVTAGNEGLTVKWNHDDSSVVSGSYVYWSELPLEASQLSASATVSRSGKLTTTSYRIEGLENGKKYYVAVTAFDANDNESSPSKAQTGSPVNVADAWQTYKQAGGGEEGGFAPCSMGRAAAAGGWWLAALLPIGWLAWRRRRPSLGRQATLAWLTVGALAGGSLLASRAEAVSPQTNSLDLRFGRYLPGIDNAFASGTKPYATILVDPTWEANMSLDATVWDRFGTLAVGLSLGYWNQVGQGREVATGEVSGDSTTLSIIPISLDVAYRFDVMAERWNIPLVPYVKTGLMYGVWWFRDGAEEISSWTAKNGTTYQGMGGTGGLHGTLGLRFLLDVLEPMAARSFDIEMGVNHSYLFAEYQARYLNDFGSTKSIDLSDGVVSFGVAFDL